MEGIPCAPRSPPPSPSAPASRSRDGALGTQTRPLCEDQPPALPAFIFPFGDPPPPFPRIPSCSLNPGSRCSAPQNSPPLLLPRTPKAAAAAAAEIGGDNTAQLPRSHSRICFTPSPRLRAQPRAVGSRAGSPPPLSPPSPLYAAPPGEGMQNSSRRCVLLLGTVCTPPPQKKGKFGAVWLCLHTSVGHQVGWTPPALPPTPGISHSLCAHRVTAGPTKAHRGRSTGAGDAKEV